MRKNKMISVALLMLSLSGCGESKSESKLNSEETPSEEALPGLPRAGDIVYSPEEVRALLDMEEGRGERSLQSVCIAKNRDFIGQTFSSAEVALPELVAITESLKKCVDWSARDLKKRDPGQCYIAGCSPTVLVDGRKISEILANLIAGIIGP